jgi:superoxide dismutase, Fe-Mn family
VYVIQAGGSTEHARELHQDTIFLSILTISQLASPTRRIQHRSKHTIPALLGNKDEIFSKYGVPGFLSASTYASTWVTYQTHLCNLLNREVMGTTYEAMSVRDLHATLSRRPADAALYNLAASAHHNHFFWNGLSSYPDPIYPSTGLRADICEYFESLDHLRDEITDVALSMHGQGYIWLMKELSPAHSLHILATYNAGSPFPAAHSRRQSFDAATGTDLSSALGRPQNDVGSFGPHSANRKGFHNGALKSLPILCLKVWEHQWLLDYGITGKEEYVRNWWGRIDWDEVQTLYNLVPEDPGQLHHMSRRNVGEGQPKPLHPLMREAQRSMPSAS